ncbi:MAG: beta-glucosidase [Thermodesulfobacteriota bacterium]
MSLMKTDGKISARGMPWTTESLSDEQIQEKARAILSQMTMAEKIDQMSGDIPMFPGILGLLFAYNKRPYPAGENRRLGIPGIRFSDGPRGVVMYRSTCFPVAMARGATWDPDLEERIGDAIGVEARSQGANFFGGVCINLLRHPAWGRAQETYGEDPHHLGELGAAMVRGAQRHVMACVKHYAANSMENARFTVDVRINERALREVYLPHFKRCVDEGAASVMSAYNRVNGNHCGHNRRLLTEILKKEWGFDGFVISDFLLGIRDTVAAAAGGMDIEMPFTWHFGRRLLRQVRKGRVPEERIDDAVLRILRQKLRFAKIGEPSRYGRHAVGCEAHRRLAREAAVKSMVLLKNDPMGDQYKPLLPIDATKVKTIAIIGKLAHAKNIGDTGSSMVRPPYVITVLEGIRAAVSPEIKIIHHKGSNLNSAAHAAQNADMVIIVAGYTHRQEGEYFPFPPKGGDRDVLTLTPHDEDLIGRVVRANPRTAVVLMGGSAIVTENWRHKAPAILMAWYPGMEGGHAIADILFGKVNTGGRLPCVFPRSAAQLPFFDRKAKSIEYGLYHGYRLMDKKHHEPAFAFGFGLSYTTFTYSNLRLDSSEIGMDGSLGITIDITNNGSMAGDEVVQLYVEYTNATIDRPDKELKGFRRIRLKPGETRAVEFTLSARQLSFYDEKNAKWIVEAVSYRIYVGKSSSHTDLIAAAFKITNHE